MNERLPFHVQLKRERLLRGWSQKDLADKVGHETRSVMRWESGQIRPQSEAQQRLFEIFGKNAEEFGLLDASAEESDSDSEADASTLSDTSTIINPPPQSAFYREELEEAPNTDGFCGRQEECEQFTRWIIGERCQLVAILGLGGMGKTTLAAHVVRMVKGEFNCIFWRSLKNAPPLAEVLKACLHFLQPERFQDLPETIDEQISRLIRCLREQRCLLVFDNLETILQPGERAGSYRSGYRDYEQLFRRIGEGTHDSCLLLTSREKPGELIAMEGRGARVNTLRLVGLPYEESREMLQEKILQGSDEQWKSLIERYAGNPLALKLVASSIQDIFGNQISAFLQEQAFVFDNIDELLDQHFERLTAQERELLYWLAVEREALSRDDLRANLVRVPVRTGVLLETLGSLHRRSLIEMVGEQRYFLQPVILEYVTTNLVQAAYEQFLTLTHRSGDGPGALSLWQHFAFLKTATSDYVREAQTRMILAPLAEQLVALVGKSALQDRLKTLLDQLRHEPVAQGYLAGNLLNMLVHLGSNLRGLDCSGLTIRQAYLQNVLLPETNFARASFFGSVFTNTFGAVLSVAFHPAENLLAAGTANGDIWLYQVADGVPLHTCSGHTDGVWGLSFSPDGQWLASSSDDATVRIWRVSTGEMRHLLTEHTNRVRSVAFSPDGEMLASGSDDQRICLWASANGQLLRALEGHSDGVRAVAFHPTGRWLASGAMDCSVHLWDLHQAEPEVHAQIFRDHTDRVRAVAFHPAGHLLASAGDDKTVRLWDLQERRCVHVLRDHTNRVWSIAYSHNGEVLASGGEDCSVRLWDSATAQCRQVLQAHEAGVRAVAFDTNSLLVSGADDQTIRLWESRTGRSLKTFQGYSIRVWSIAFGSSPGLLASVSDDQALRLWDLRTGHCLKTVPMSHQNVRAIATSPVAPLLGSVGGDQLLHLWEFPSGQHVRVLRGHTNWVRTVTFSSDGQLVASGGEDNLVMLWNPRNGQLLHKLAAHQNLIRALAFSPDNRLLASGGDDCVIYLWDTQTGELRQTLRGHEQNIRALVFHPTSNLLFSASEDQTICMWECTAGTALRSLAGHTSRVMGLDIHPNGSSLVSCGDDFCICLWDLVDEAVSCRRIERAHAGRVRVVLYSRDGSRLASCGDDGIIRIWDANTLAHQQDLISERPYERMNITDASGLTDAQKAALRILGAIEE